MASEGISGELFKFPDELLSHDPCCAICLGKHEDKSFPNNCIHEFCFGCLLQWSKVKPECPLCVQTFSSIIHNIKSDNEYDEQCIAIVNPCDWSGSEYSDSASDSSSWDINSESSWYTISTDEDICLSEQTSSHSQNFSHAAERIYFEFNEELREPFNYESSSSEESFTSWGTVSESSSEEHLSALPLTFSRQLVLSEQSLENLDALLLSVQSDLAAANGSTSLLTPLPPRPSRIGRVSLVIDEGESNVDATPQGTSTIRGPQCEIVYRWLQDSLPSDEVEIGLKVTGTDLAFCGETSQKGFLLLPPKRDCIVTTSEQPRPTFSPGSG